MKARKVLFLSLFVGMLGVSGSSNATFFDDYMEHFYNATYGVKIDSQGRRLGGHEDDGRSKPWSQKLGHTIESHVDKTSFYLAKRCQDFRRRGQTTPFASTYRSINIAAEINRRSIKIDKRKFDASVRNTRENKNFFLHADMGINNGFAVDCRAFDKSELWDYPYFDLQFYTGRAGSYHRTGFSIIKKRNNQPGHWFLLTSYPK